MNESIFSLEQLLASFHEITAQVIAYLPRVAASILILLAGWLLAKMFRVLVSRLVVHISNIWNRVLVMQGLEMPARRPPQRIAGEIVYWLTLVIFLTLAAEVLGLDIFVTGLKQILGYFPLVIGGLLIMMIGFVISSIVRQIVASASASAELMQGDLLARSAQLVILFIAIILGIEQIGINTTFLSVIAGIFLATMLGGFALAFGFGARTHVSNIIAANQLQQFYKLGDKIRLDNFEGRIIDITASRVMIDTENGTVDIPAKYFDEKISVILERGS